MRKAILTICGAVLVAAMLAGCCMKHEWAEATCTEPKKCVKCGETEGVANGHKWKAATCTTPKTCETCGKTEGEALGHTWVDRTMEKPKTCSVCGATEGKPIAFTELSLEKINADIRNIDRLMFMPKTIACVKMADAVCCIYDYDEKLIKEIPLNLGNSEKGRFDCNLLFDSNLENDGWIITTYGDEENNFTIRVFNERGEEVASTREKANVPEGQSLELRNVSDDGYMRFYASEDGYMVKVKPRLVIDSKTMTVAAIDAGIPVAWFDTKDYRSVADMIHNEKYCLATSLDGKKKYYIHPKYYSIKAEFVDASDFNSSGYALASTDGKSYDLLDTDLNVVGAGVGEGSWATWFGDTVFLIYRDKQYHWYSVK
ncbi:MAG: hypothetical protein K6E71_05305 [Lachnospiraceae bacterium]|nr:hypothetical protein [Lachnospiraceae bacterium]